MPFLDRWFFAEVLGAAEPIFRQAGLDLLLYHVGDREARREYFSMHLLRKRVDGVLLVNLPLAPSEVDALLALDIPVCTVGIEAEGFHSVSIDDVAAATTAVQHLINLGHQRVALIAGDTEDATLCGAPRDRRTGYRVALEASGLPLDQNLEARGDFTAMGGARAAAELFARRRPPTAIFAESDEMAIGAMGTLSRLGLRVPEDVSVVGFDDYPLAKVLDLTTISQSVADQGRTVAEQLVAALEGADEDAQKQVQVATRLILRGTTAIASSPRVPLRPTRLVNEEKQKTKRAIAT
jgi:DNA-binding LacI/PurR family transcriptional regulator